MQDLLLSLLLEGPSSGSTQYHPRCLHLRRIQFPQEIHPKAKSNSLSRHLRGLFRNTRRCSFPTKTIYRATLSMALPIVFKPSSSPAHETGNQLEDNCFHADASRALPTSLRVSGACTRNSNSFLYLRLICNIARSCSGCLETHNRNRTRALTGASVNSGRASWM